VILKPTNSVASSAHIEAQLAQTTKTLQDLALLLMNQVGALPDKVCSLYQYSSHPMDECPMLQQCNEENQASVNAVGQQQA